MRTIESFEDYVDPNQEAIDNLLLPSSGPAPGSEPATSRSAVKRSTEWAILPQKNEEPYHFAFTWIVIIYRFSQG